ncbi:MAG: hypothetical protein IPO41_12110 [Acidobacteria bacterium]|nr:hypothetical protein [Acidobacteriota bacterium]MBK9529033.1 hypothetical protein [Acidobacteriota bacterium]MBP7475720.1 hypothetical protein [Pyrinomonadaceae bacterium]
MKFRDKFIPTNCYLRSDCRQDADRYAFRSLFEREWEVFVVKRDPVNGGFKGETVCCEEALQIPHRGLPRNEASI